MRKLSERRHSRRTSSALATAAFVVCAVTALPAADDPQAIIQEAQKRSTAASQRYEGLLQVFESNGKVADKRWTYERIGSHGRSKVILRFTAPAEVRGVAILIANHPDRASDQWMWTPALERDRRIALQDRSTRFFGTDFSFEDLEERDVDQYDYVLMGVEPLDGIACWRIQSTPRQARASQYTRSMVWIRQDNYAWMRIENFADTRVVRRLVYSDIQNIQGIWTARQLEMADLTRGSRTRLTLEKLQYNLPFNDADFTIQALRRQ